MYRDYAEWRGSWLSVSELELELPPTQLARGKLETPHPLILHADFHVPEQPGP